MLFCAKYESACVVKRLPRKKEGNFFCQWNQNESDCLNRDSLGNLIILDYFKKKIKPTSSVLSNFILETLII